MLIGEILTSSSDDIIKESDEFILKSALDTILLNIKSALEHNRQAVFTLDQVIAELNTKTEVYIDPKNDDRRNSIIQAFEQHGMEVERGSGKIAIQHMDATQTDDKEAEQERKSQEIAGKAMDKIRQGGDTEL